MKIKLSSSTAHLNPDRLKGEPRIWDEKMPHKEVVCRLDRIVKYNLGQSSNHLVSRERVEVMLSVAGYDPALAGERGAGVPAKEIQRLLKAEADAAKAKAQLTEKKGVPA